MTSKRRLSGSLALPEIAEFLRKMMGRPRKTWHRTPRLKPELQPTEIVMDDLFDEFLEITVRIVTAA
jgi:hypothetical protein